MSDGVVAALASLDRMRADRDNLSGLLSEANTQRDRVQADLVAAENRGVNAERWALAWKAKAKDLRSVVRGLTVPSLRSLHFEDGHFMATMQGKVIPMLADWFAEFFVRGGGKNYVEILLESEKIGGFTLTMQRTQGKTPNQLRLEAESALAVLRAQLAEAMAVVGAMREAMGEEYDMRWPVDMPATDGAPQCSECGFCITSALEPEERHLGTCKRGRKFAILNASTAAADWLEAVRKTREALKRALSSVNIARDIEMKLYGQSRFKPFWEEQALDALAALDAAGLRVPGD